MVKSILGTVVSIFFFSSLAQAIVDGDQVPAKKFGESHPGQFNTVALMKEPVPGQLKVFCTGSIIDEDLILTAKHCVNGRKPNEMKIYFGLSQDNLQKDLLREITEVHEFGEKRKWQDYFPNKDLAVVKIKGGLPEGFRKLEILRSIDPLEKGMEITIVGYGNTVASPSVIKAGTKLTADIQLEEYIHNAHFYHLLIFNSDSGQGACHGDSGGPAYAYVSHPGQKKPQWYIVGVTNGFDLALTPETIVETGDDLFPLMAHCDKGQVIYTFAGALWQWIEKVSERRLEFSPLNLPMPPEKKVDQSGFRTFVDWCEKVDHFNPAWLTVKELMLEALKHKNKSAGETDRDIFFNCQRAAQILDGLEELNFDEYSFFSDFSPFASLQNLKRLKIRDRDFSKADFSPLNESQSLQDLQLREVKLGGLESLAKLKNHPTLKRISIERDQISDLRALKGWTTLESLVVHRTGLIELSGLETLTNLKELSIGYNKVKDLSLVSGLTQLQSLDIAGNPIEDISSLTNLTRLETLEAENTKLQSLAAIAKLPLIKLNLSGVKGVDFTPLQQVTSLKNLSVNSTGLKNVEFLASLNQLVRLEVASNSIVDLGVFAKNRFSALSRLVIAGNQINDLSPLVGLSSVRQIWAGGNPITNGGVKKTEANCPTQSGPDRLRFVCRR